RAPRSRSPSPPGPVSTSTRLTVRSRSRCPTWRRCSPPPGSPSRRWAGDPRPILSSSGRPPQPPSRPPGCCRAIGRLRPVQKLERLLNLTAVLLHSGRPMSAAELRERVPGYPDSDVAFHRAFERDKDDLREMGVPLELEEIPGADPPLDGYRIPRGRYYLPAAGLAPEELAALQLAAAAVQLDGVEGVEALWKLGGSAADPAAASIPTVAAIPTDPNLAPLFEAVSQRAPARFTYRDEHR